MRLLFDQNLSPALVKFLADLFPESDHVENIGLGGAADHAIAARAKAGGFVVVTKDSDFLAPARAPLECKVILDSFAELQHCEGPRPAATCCNSNSAFWG